MQDYNIHESTTLTVSGNANVNSISWQTIIMVNDNVAELDETAIITVVAAQRQHPGGTRNSAPGR